MARRRACIVAAAAILIARVGTTWAGGSWLYEIGAPDLGTANAGRAALASDASTAFGNPAGMARLERSQLLFGLQPIIATNEFDTGPNTTTPGTNGGNAGGLVPSAGLYYRLAAPTDRRAFPSTGKSASASACSTTSIRLTPSASPTSS